MVVTSGIVDMLAVFTPEGAFTDNPVPELTRSPSVQQPVTPDELIEYMDEYGVEHCVIPARCYGQHWGVPYDALAAFVAHHPDRLHATAGINPHAGTPGLREFERAVRELGFVGAHTYSTWAGIPADDRLYYPYYAKAEELGVPFQLEVYGNHHGPVSCKPDQVARITWDFPELTLMAIHTGYPWVDDLVFLAGGRRNLHIGCDISPMVWTPALLDFIKGDAGHAWGGRSLTPAVRPPDYLDSSDKVHFGTNGGRHIPETLALIDEFGLPAEILRKLLSDNSRRTFGIGGAERRGPDRRLGTTF